MVVPSESETVQLLEELGLTEYQARCFVALSRVQTATATEVSDLSGVPRSRVYDAVDALHERGLVDVQQSEPREYKAVPPETALETLRSDYESTVEDAGEAFERLETAQTQEESGAWAIADHDRVTERIASLIEGAEEEIYLLLVDEALFEGEVADAVAARSEAGADVIVEVPSEDVRSEFESAVPEATVRRTELAELTSEVDGKWLGRILMVDRHSVLISSVAEGLRPGRTEETAIWASGADHGLVVGLRHLLGLRIDSPETMSELG